MLIIKLNKNNITLIVFGECIQVIKLIVSPKNKIDGKINNQLYSFSNIIDLFTPNFF